MSDRAYYRYKYLLSLFIALAGENYFVTRELISKAPRELFFSHGTDIYIFIYIDFFLFLLVYFIHSYLQGFATLPANRLYNIYNNTLIAFSRSNNRSTIINHSSKLSSFSPSKVYSLYPLYKKLFYSYSLSRESIFLIFFPYDDISKKR